MKTVLRTMHRGGLGLAALLVCGSMSLAQAAAPVSPVGTWDCLFSGVHGQKGIAFLTFSNDGTNRTFDGFELLVANPSSSSGDDLNVRSLDDSQGRTLFEGSAGSSTTTSEEKLIGFGEVAGTWTYDSKGRVVGSLIQFVNASGETTNYGTMCLSNQFTVVTNQTLFVTNLSFCFDTATFTTNVTWTEPTNASFTFTFNNTNFSVGPSTVETTNQISFVGKVVPGKRLTLKCSTTFGKASFQGVPYTAHLKDLTGGWQATRKQGGQTFFETFDLTSFGTGNPFETNVVADSVTNFPNIYYTTNNAGPGYTNIAISALSSHKKIGFVFGTGGELRASLGSFSSTKSETKANTKGLELPNTSFTFKATLVP